MATPDGFSLLGRAVSNYLKGLKSKRCGSSIRSAELLAYVVMCVYLSLAAPNFLTERWDESFWWKRHYPGDVVRRALHAHIAGWNGVNRCITLQPRCS